MPTDDFSEYDANSIKRKRPETQVNIRAYLLRVKREGEQLRQRKP